MCWRFWNLNFDFIDKFRIALQQHSFYGGYFKFSVIVFTYVAHKIDTFFRSVQRRLCWQKFPDTSVFKTWKLHEFKCAAYVHNCAKMIDSFYNSESNFSDLRINNFYYRFHETEEARTVPFYFLSRNTISL